MATYNNNIPNSKPTKPNHIINKISNNPLHITPNNPTPNAEPINIITDFLHTNTGFNNNHTITHTFLTPKTSKI